MATHRQATRGRPKPRCGRGCSERSAPWRSSSSPRAGCGSDEAATTTRPARPLRSPISIAVTGERIGVSPARVGAGPVVLLIANESGRSRDVTLDRGGRLRQIVRRRRRLERPDQPAGRRAHTAAARRGHVRGRRRRRHARARAADGRARARERPAGPAAALRRLSRRPPAGLASARMQVLDAHRRARDRRADRARRVLLARPRRPDAPSSWPALARALRLAPARARGHAGARAAAEARPLRRPDAARLLRRARDEARRRGAASWSRSTSSSAASWVVTVRRGAARELDELRQRLAGRPHAATSSSSSTASSTRSPTRSSPCWRRSTTRSTSWRTRSCCEPTDEQLQRVFHLKRRLVALRRIVTPQRDLAARTIDDIDELPGPRRRARATTSATSTTT